MGQSLSKNYIHLVFSTKSHKKFIDKIISYELFRYISTAKLLEEIKKSSSKWIKTKGDNYRHFQWQGGYASFSVSQSYVTSIRKYIENQEVHHKKISFRNELKKLLDDYYIVYDERYLWN